jgi:hypothetical protein
MLFSAKYPVPSSTTTLPLSVRLPGTYRDEFKGMRRALLSADPSSSARELLAIMKRFLAPADKTWGEGVRGWVGEMSA